MMGIIPEADLKQRLQYIAEEAKTLGINLDVETLERVMRSGETDNIIAGPDELLTADYRDEIPKATQEELRQLAQMQFLAASAHQHKFTYLLNQGHTALRGCKCGLAYVGLMAGSVDDLKWHQVGEGEE